GTILSVSELSFGNFIFGSHMWGKTPADAPEGVRLQNLAFDLGVNFFDTGDAYSNGHAERLMADTLNYAGRDKVVLSTKFGYDFYNDPGTPGSHKERKQDFSERFIRFALEQSLQRMGTDHVDLYQAHNMKLPQMTQEFPAIMEKLVKEGKVKHWGIALGPAIGWREEGVAAIKQWPKCCTVQTVFNMLEQHPGREFCELAAETGTCGVMSRVPHSSGILQDIYSADEKFDDHRKFRDKNWLIYGLKKVEKLRHIQAAHNCTMGQLALKWLLTWATLVSVQPNIMNEADLREFAAACDGDRLTTTEMAEIQALVESDFGFGADAHACDLKSSVDASGHTRSQYQRGERVPALA
ncbi:MAG TPA: aldo/keto reductase, partial [Phycisphaerae bacterium]|nr:aldo/keto reductase [Phycisphaerae bacterium]